MPLPNEETAAELENRQTVDINVEIRDLPIKVNRQLNGIAAMLGMTKWELIRAALVEYAQRHTDEAIRGFKSSLRGGA